MEKRATMPAFLTIYSILNGGSTMAVLLPTLAVKHVTDITPEMLHVMKVKGMILDVTIRYPDMDAQFRLKVVSNGLMKCVRPVLK